MGFFDIDTSGILSLQTVTCGQCGATHGAADAHWCMAPKKPAYPKRAHSIAIDAGADTKEDLLWALRQIVADLEAGSVSSVSGAPSSGWHWTYTQDDSMTHERYMEQINACIAADKVSA